VVFGVWRSTRGIQQRLARRGVTDVDAT
jgi:hypothetical protein